MTKVLINEKLVDEQDANVPYNDRGYVFGDGIYEYIRVYDNNVLQLKNILKDYYVVLKKSV